MKTESKKKGLRLGMGELELVFTNEGGNVIDVNNWRNRVFNKALKKAGMRKIRIHDIRHSYATIRIQAGHNIADVSNQLGHHSIKFTMDVYYHWIPGKQKSEVDSLDSLHLPEPYTNPNLKNDEQI
jgi:integrase